MHYQGKQPVYNISPTAPPVLRTLLLQFSQTVYTLPEDVVTASDGLGESAGPGDDGDRVVHGGRSLQTTQLPTQRAGRVSDTLPEISGSLGGGQQVRTGGLKVRLGQMEVTWRSGKVSMVGVRHGQLEISVG